MWMGHWRCECKRPVNMVVRPLTFKQAIKDVLNCQVAIQNTPSVWHDLCSWTTFVHVIEARRRIILRFVLKFLLFSPSFSLLLFLYLLYLSFSWQEGHSIHRKCKSKQSASFTYESSLINIWGILVSCTILHASFGYVGFSLPFVKEVVN